jgi:hypothetical protein
MINLIWSEIWNLAAVEQGKGFPTENPVKIRLRMIVWNPASFLFLELWLKSLKIKTTSCPLDVIARCVPIAILESDPPLLIIVMLTFSECR